MKRKRSYHAEKKYLERQDARWLKARDALSKSSTARGIPFRINPSYRKADNKMKDSVSKLYAVGFGDGPYASEKRANEVAEFRKRYC